jgi:hypothetical protein
LISAHWLELEKVFLRSNNFARREPGRFFLMPPAWGFPVKAGFLDLPGFEKAHDDGDSFRSPTARRWQCGENAALTGAGGMMDNAAA